MFFELPQHFVNAFFLLTKHLHLHTTNFCKLLLLMDDLTSLVWLHKINCFSSRITSLLIHVTIKWSTYKHETPLRIILELILSIIIVQNLRHCLQLWLQPIPEYSTVNWDIPYFIFLNNRSIFFINFVKMSQNLFI